MKLNANIIDEDDIVNKKYVDNKVNDITPETIGAMPFSDNVITYQDYSGGQTGGTASVLIDANTLNGKSASEFVLNTNETLLTEDKTVIGAINEVFQDVDNGKTIIATAITDKGINTNSSDSFVIMANNISSIPTGSDTSDATAIASNILAGTTAYIAEGKVNGAMPNRGGFARQITTQGGKVDMPGEGYYAGGFVEANITNLVADNIKNGVNVGGIVGTFLGIEQAVMSLFFSSAVNLNIRSIYMAQAGREIYNQPTITGGLKNALTSTNVYINQLIGLVIDYYNSSYHTTISGTNIEILKEEHIYYGNGGYGGERLFVLINPLGECSLSLSRVSNG